MKFKTTQKAIKEGYNTIICVPYCGLQNLLNYESPIAYTSRCEGWAADIYDMGGGVAIATGYAPFGNVRPSYESREQYETQDILEGAFTTPEEIPDYIIFEHYDGICFTDDDFFCTAENGNFENCGAAYRDI